MSASEVPSTRASVETQVTLQPKASQTFLVSVSVLTGVCVICGSALLGLGIGAGWAIGGLSLPMMGAAFYAWRVSQSDTDLDSSAPTTVSSPDGMQISTDSRNLRSPEAISGLVQLLKASCRTALPEPDALFENGMIVPGSMTEAQARNRQINDHVEGLTRSVEVLLNGSPDEPMILERPIESDTLPNTSDMNAVPLSRENN